LEAIKLQLNEMVRNWAGIHLTGLNEEIHSIVCDINELEHKYLTIHDSGLSSSSMHTASLTSLPRPHKDSSPIVPPRSKLSLKSDIAQHKSSCPSVSVTTPDSFENHRRRTIGTTMSVPRVENRITAGPSSRVRYPIHPRPHRRSYNISSSVERRPSLPAGVRCRSASVSESNQKRNSSIVVRRNATCYPPKIVFESTRLRHRSCSTSQSTHPPLPPRHRHSLSPSYGTAHHRFFEPVLDELDEEDEPYAIVQPLAYIDPRSLRDYSDSAPSRKDVESLPVLANIQAKLLKRNSTLKRKTRPIIRKKRSLNDSDDGDSESESVPQKNNIRHRRRSSYNPSRKISLPKSVKPVRKSLDSFNSSVKLDMVALAEEGTKGVDIAVRSLPSSEGENDTITPNKVIIIFHLNVHTSK